MLLCQESVPGSTLAEPKGRGYLLDANADFLALSEPLLGSAGIPGFNNLLYFDANRINLNSRSQQAVLSLKLRQHPVYTDK